ncbi:MAG: hypothetical protein PHE29_02850 [Tissierellia bacterium]|nr:hypothetical protein [Tissierellia bacterium]
MKVGVNILTESVFSDHDKKLFEYILDNIPDSITIVDVNCKVIFF